MLERKNKIESGKTVKKWIQLQTKLDERIISSVKV
jgi:hypothetical protein